MSTISCIYGLEHIYSLASLDSSFQTGADCKNSMKKNMPAIQISIKFGNLFFGFNQ